MYNLRNEINILRRKCQFLLVSKFNVSFKKSSEVFLFQAESKSKLLWIFSE